MLSLFPSLFAWSFAGVATLRIGLGLIIGARAIYFLKNSRRQSGSKSWLLGLIEIVLAILLIIGLWTQAAALLVAVIALGSLALNYHYRSDQTDGDSFHFIIFQLLVLVVSLSLITLGPGNWAIDLPL